MTTEASNTAVEKTDDNKPTRKKRSAEVQVVQSVQAAVPAVTTPDSLLRLAVENNFDLDKLTKLLELKDDYDKKQARKDYFYALSRFQSAVPEIKKSKQVLSPSKNGGNVDYWYSPLSEVVKQIQPAMAAAELSHRWETRQFTLTAFEAYGFEKFIDRLEALFVTTDDAKRKTAIREVIRVIVEEGSKVLGEFIEVICIITHINGHEERNKMQVPADNSGGKNQIQQVGSSITYAQRYTLIGALGLSSADTDVDAQSKKAKTPKGGETVKKAIPTEAQYKSMIQLVKDGKRTVKSFVDSCDLSDEQVLDLTSYVPQK